VQKENELKKNLLDAQNKFSAVIEDLSRKQEDLENNLNIVKDDLASAISVIKEKDQEIKRLQNIIKIQELELTKLSLEESNKS